MVASQKSQAQPCDSPDAVYSLLAPSMQDLDREMCVVVLLNTKNRLIKICETGLGSLNESVCHPREILRPAIVHQAYCFVFAHNHPSGDPRPSAADDAFTRKLAHAGTILRIPLLDHVIIGRPGSDQTGVGYFSFKAAGLLAPNA
jgi:DNA repair protein RadC